MQKEFFVPGRLCLFGEHSDWAGGYRAIEPSIAVGHCLAAGVNQGIHEVAHPHPDRLIITSMLPCRGGPPCQPKIFGPTVFPMDERQLLAVAKQGGFFSYCAGVAYYIQRKFFHPPRIRGERGGGQGDFAG